MSSVWDMILQWGSTIKVSIELPVATRHRRDMIEKLLKATLNPNSHTFKFTCISENLTACPIFTSLLLTVYLYFVVTAKFHFYLIADILTKVFQKCSLSSPLPNIWILSKPLNFSGCHGNQKWWICEKILKNYLLRSHGRWSWNVHNISLYKVSVFYCCCSYAFVAMAT